MEIRIKENLFLLTLFLFFVAEEMYWLGAYVTYCNIVRLYLVISNRLVLTKAPEINDFRHYGLCRLNNYRRNQIIRLWVSDDTQLPWRPNYGRWIHQRLRSVGCCCSRRVGAVVRVGFVSDALLGLSRTVASRISCSQMWWKKKDSEETRRRALEISQWDKKSRGLEWVASGHCRRDVPASSQHVRPATSITLSPFSSLFVKNFLLHLFYLFIFLLVVPLSIFFVRTRKSILRQSKSPVWFVRIRSFHQLCWSCVRT